MISFSARCRPFLVLCLVFLPLFPMIVGCGGGGSPFEIVPVTGKVTYDDGTPIKADTVTVTFIPQDIKPVGREHAGPAKVDLKPDGSFSYLSTDASNDGAVVGRHKVIVTASNNFVPCPEAIAAEYQAVSTTPLEVTVTSEGPNQFDDLKVKPGP